MSITKDFLTGLGLTAEQTSAIFAERGKEITESNKQIADLTAENKTLQSSITDLNAEKDNLAKLAGDAEAYKKQLDDYNAAAKAKEEKDAADAADKALTAKIEAVFGDKKFTSDYVRNGLIADIKKAHSEDNTKGLSEIFTELTKDKTGYFENTHKKIEMPGSSTSDSSADEVAKVRRIMGLPAETK